ncbi:hypothetical protein SODALDRAFT_347001 [Sodiomyces alkalinus F11]|uniref:DNA polymerase delta subunit 3 n=1 Tax=Sodiomyces alkalinus (strain CBS 110278 / VKM F-3762 / F11) TaxID=1314773 RepID=A0A3N2Q501_SODAK|nr:hypothetical protein SODALDRAFT_347001 [Sodiomyces alkalinus F11]ROT41853.1 hypothetical protein SODALDRAFT_347001 [Sodiomyces alkalinus F11]
MLIFRVATMEDYKKYLAERLFTEDKMVTYRTLSRALKVHVNVAKAMLYDFHRWQNAMTHGKVHATYLVYGTKKPEMQDDGDVEMSGSSREGNTDEEVFTQTLSLASQDRLSEVLSTYQHVTSFQVYSLSAHPLKQVQLLSDVTREVLDYSHEDSAERSKQYGSMFNAHMRKRDRHGKRPQAAPVSSANPVEKKAAITPASSSSGPKKPTEKTTEKTTEKPTEAAAKVKEEPKDTAVKEEKPPAKTRKAAPPTLKRGASSSSGGIMSAFSKAVAKASSKSASASSTPKPEEQTTPVLSDDGEDDSEAVPAPKKVADDTAARAKKQREDELRLMMEESDGEESEQKEEDEEMGEDAPIEEAPEPEVEAEAEAEAEAEPEAKTKSKKREAEPTEIISASGDGRRRGRRRVMKKKQTVDSQGYLVTIQEPGWESFSEDETPSTPASAPAPAPAPTSSKAKISSTSSPAGSQSSKGKKAGARSQGSIMSFFSKK